MFRKQPADARRLANAAAWNNRLPIVAPSSMSSRLVRLLRRARRAAIIALFISVKVSVFSPPPLDLAAPARITMESRFLTLA
jgi:hypothetical protein